MDPSVNLAARSRPLPRPKPFGYHSTKWSLYFRPNEHAGASCCAYLATTKCPFSFPLLSISKGLFFTMGPLEIRLTIILVSLD